MFQNWYWVEFSLVERGHQAKIEVKKGEDGFLNFRFSCTSLIQFVHFDIEIIVPAASVYGRLSNLVSFF